MRILLLSPLKPLKPNFDMFEMTTKDFLSYSKTRWKLYVLTVTRAYLQYISIMYVALVVG